MIKGGIKISLQKKLNTLDVYIFSRCMYALTDEIEEEVHMVDLLEISVLSPDNRPVFLIVKVFVGHPAVISIC